VGRVGGGVRMCVLLGLLAIITSIADPLAIDVIGTFTTSAAPKNGTSGPILVIYNSSNPFTRYYSRF